MSNLPSWPGADAAYAKAYRITANMARAGYVETVKRDRHRRCHVKPELSEYIDALNAGDEERIKGLNYMYRAYS